MSINRMSSKIHNNKYDKHLLTFIYQIKAQINKLKCISEQFYKGMFEEYSK